MRVIASSAPGALELAINVLEDGGLIAIPTETVYGLCVLPTEAGLGRLMVAKQRSTEKGIQLLIDTVEQASAVAVLTPVATLLASRFWPGPLTLVLERRPDVALPALLGGGRPTLGLRLPDHDVPRRLARRLGPLAASSANVSGQPDATTADVVVTTLGDAVDLVLDGGPVRGGVPSSVVGSLPGRPVEVYRVGAISAERLLADLPE